MSIILWNRTAQNVIQRGGRDWVFKDAADANSNLNYVNKDNIGLLARMTEEAVRAGTAAPVIDLITVT